MFHMLRKCICTAEFLIPICQFLELSAMVMCHLKIEGEKTTHKATVPIITWGTFAS